MPAPPAFGTEDYQQAMLNLLPRGRIWRRDPDSVLAQVLGALAPTYERGTAAAAALLVDAFPTTTFNLLPEWEASLGLPDSCAPADQTIASRQASVAAKWAARGGQTTAYFIKLAAALGFPITITEFAPARYGRPNYGKPRYGRDWAYAWQVNAPSVVVTPAKYGSHVYREPYSTWGNAILQCEINKMKPAHTVVIFSYTGAPAVALWDEGVWGRDAWAS